MSIPSEEQFKRGVEALAQKYFAPIRPEDQALLDKYRERFERITSDAVIDERERCAQLAEALATIHEEKAKELRKPVRGLIFKYVPPYNEQHARFRDASVHSLRTIAGLIRDGYPDVRKIEPDPNERIELPPIKQQQLIPDVKGPPNWTPCENCTDPMDCGSWMHCFNGNHSCR